MCSRTSNSNHYNPSSLCRICLRDGATYPIFVEVNKETRVHSKLECLNEKIEDKEGYPRNICYTCNDTLDIVYDFVTRLRQSHKILEGGLVSDKQESKDNTSNLKTDKITCKINQSKIASVETECLNTLEIRDNDNGCGKQPFVYKLQIDNGNVESNKTETSINKIKCPAEILGALSNITIKRVKVGSGSDKEIIPVESKKDNIERDGDLPRNTLKTKNCAAKRHEKGHRATTGKLNGGHNKEQLIRLNKLKLLQDLEEKRKKLALQHEQFARLCDLCGEIYSSSEQLSKHKRQTHAERKFKCTLCPKNYRTKRELKEHVSNHKNIRNFICDTCSRAFFSKKHLKQHIAALHENKKQRRGKTARKTALQCTVTNIKRCRSCVFDGCCGEADRKLANRPAIASS